MGLLNRTTKIFTSWPKGAKSRPPFEGFYVYLLALFTGYLIADLSILSVRPAMLPTQPPPMRPSRPMAHQHTSVSQYAKIEKRNIFNNDGKIPPPLTSSGGETIQDNSAPVLSQLQLKLEGTLVHSNPRRSVATITLKAKNEARAFMVDSEIDTLAKITAIERRKVIFRNLNNGRLEYIDIPNDSALTFGVKDPVVNTGTEEVQKKGEFDFTMRRSDINKYTANLGEVLQQARMVPNIVPGSGGRVDGFRFVNIQPGSIYEKLGFKPMDVIKKVNGSDIDSPTKAMELYNALRAESRISLTVERNGRDEQFKYDVHE